MKMKGLKCNRYPTFFLFFDFRSVYKSFIDLYILEQVYDCVKVLKSLLDDQKQKFCDGNLEDIFIFQQIKIFPFNIFGELLEIGEALASNRNVAIRNMLIKINSDVSDAVNVRSLAKKYNTKMKNINKSSSLYSGNDLIIVFERKNKSFLFF